MRIDKRLLDENFPLSGGERNSFKYGKQALILLFIVVFLIMSLSAR